VVPYLLISPVIPAQKSVMECSLHSQSLPTKISWDHPYTSFHSSFNLYKIHHILWHKINVFPYWRVSTDGHGKNILKSPSQHQQFTHVILGPQEAESRRITIQSKPKQVLLQDPVSKNLIAKKGWQSGLRCRPGVQVPVPQKKKKKKSSIW
jgi:hypothetical protein